MVQAGKGNGYLPENQPTHLSMSDVYAHAPEHLLPSLSAKRQDLAKASSVLGPTATWFRPTQVSARIVP